MLFDATDTISKIEAETAEYRDLHRFIGVARRAARLLN